MKITKQNYEEYALDYVEGTLSPEQREAFDRFLDADPEAAATIRPLQESMPVLKPDFSIAYAGKAALKRKASIRPWILRAGVAAAVLLIGIVVFDRYRPGIDVVPVPVLVAAEDSLNVHGAVDAANEPANRSESQTVLLAEGASSRIGSPVKTPAETVAPTIKTEPKRETSLGGVKAPERTTPQEQETVESAAAHSGEVSEEGEIGTREVLALVSEPQRLRTGSVPAPEPRRDNDGVRFAESVHWAETPVGRVISESEEFVIESTGERLPMRETRDYFADAEDPVGLRNMLNRKGIKRLAAGILTPISGLSPIKVYENNEERTVEFASITISRRPNQKVDNQ